mgnify:CR=1 FL=1
MEKISVIITCFNREEYISLSIESVLSSDFNEFELIIVDDCSTDKSWEIIKKYSEIDDRIQEMKKEGNVVVGGGASGGGSKTKTKGFACTRVTLEVECSNEKAMSSYEAVGFQRVELLKNYYLNLGVAIRMILYWVPQEEGEGGREGGSI